MEDEKDTTAVEEGTEGAATQENEGSSIDFEAELAKKDALIDQLTKDKNNYKKGLLKAKGKLPEEEEDEEDIDAKIERKVQERMIDSQLTQAQKEKDDLYKKGLTRIKELETAIKNRSQISTADAGSGSSIKITPKDKVLSEDKIKYFKSLGWNDQKIELYKKNLMKVK